MTRTTLFASLANQTRLDILELLLKEGELSVNEVAEKLGLQQAGTSRHLIILRDGGAAKVKQIQTRRLYSAEKGVLGLIGMATQLTA